VWCGAVQCHVCLLHRPNLSSFSRVTSNTRHARPLACDDWKNVWQDIGVRCGGRVAEGETKREARSWWKQIMQTPSHSKRDRSLIFKSLDGTLPLDLRSHKSSRITHTSLPPHASSTQPIHCPGHTPPAVLSPHNEILGSARAELATSELCTHTLMVCGTIKSLDQPTPRPTHMHSRDTDACARGSILQGGARPRRRTCTDSRHTTTIAVHLDRILVAACLVSLELKLTSAPCGS
jgi:hypothetical protein